MTEPRHAYHSLCNTARWRALRKAQLQAQPLCVLCQARGLSVTPRADLCTGLLKFLERGRAHQPGRGSPLRR